MKIIHKELASGRWFQLSLAEQMANIGSEVSRACKWQGKDEDIFCGAVERALELFDLTLKDPRWNKRLKEIARARELFCDAITGGKEYKSTLKDLDRYFFCYAFYARNKIGA
ncbi:MAG: hypothetical protein WBC21_01065 [Minisyncoccales bacterium]